MEASVFSIIIPSWNNLNYLKHCCESIREYSAVEHQIIVHINDGSDGSLLWVNQQGFDYTYSDENIGICRAVNQAFKKVTHPFVMYMNDDMYVLPNWDIELSKIIDKLEDEAHFMLSATMIEPRDTGNKAVLVGDYGQSIEEFQKEKLIQELATLAKEDWNGASWPPVLMPTKTWKTVGGFSEEFSPGMYSDPDLSMKLWQLGCRQFIGVGKSKVYHFQQKSTKKIKKNNGRKQFLEKWNMPASSFYRHFLRMGTLYQGSLSQPNSLTNAFIKVKTKVKKLFS